MTRYRQQRENDDTTTTPTQKRRVRWAFFAVAAFSTGCLAVPAPPQGEDDPDPIDNGDDTSGDTDGGPPQTPRPDAGPRPRPDGGTGSAETLSHSTSNIIVLGNSLLCGDDNDHHYETSFYRVFDLAAMQPGKGFNVERVEFGVELANDGNNAGQPVTVKLHTIAAVPGNTFNTNNLSLKGTAATTVTDQALSIASVDVTGSIAAGEKLVVEISMPDGHDNSQVGHSLIIGSNSGGQTSPTYIKDECDADQPTNVASVGGGAFADVHMVMTVHGKSI